jgi:hypothetical protein
MKDNGSYSSLPPIAVDGDDWLPWEAEQQEQRIKAESNRHPCDTIQRLSEEYRKLAKAAVI